MKTVLDVLFPDKKVSVVYVDDEIDSGATTEHGRVESLVKWANSVKGEGRKSLLAEEILANSNRMIVNASDEFNHRSAAIAYKKQRIAIWKALGYKIIVR